MTTAFLTFCAGAIRQLDFEADGVGVEHFPALRVEQCVDVHTGESFVGHAVGRTFWKPYLAKAGGLRLQQMCEVIRHSCVALKYRRFGSCGLEPISRTRPRSTKLVRRVRAARGVAL